VAESRDQLEQMAMLLLQKDKKEEAVEVYLKLLKLSKGDIRVRSKLADLYLGLDKKPEAIRQLRDVAAGQLKEGQHRAASIILKRLHELNPSDVQTLGQLGGAQKEIGKIDDAKETYLKVIDMLTTRPKDAMPYVRELMSLCPGEVPPKVKYAEILGRCGQADEAFEVWVKLGFDARRRGATLDQALFLERGLKLREADMGCLEGAAEARISMGAPKEALVHIQKCYSVDPGSTRVLSMLAQCFELMDQKPKAKKVLMQLAKVYDQADAVVDRLDALMRASACDPEDASLAAEVGSAVSIAEKVKLRLTHQGWTEPKNDEETEVVVRAGVLAKYGFPDRAKVVLEASNGIRQTVSVRAMMAEVLAKLDDVAGAIAEMDAIESDEDAAKVDIATRMLVLRGDFSSLGAGVAVAVEMDVEVEDEDEEMSIEMDDEQEEYGGIEDAALDEESSPVAKVHDEREAEGDRLAAAGDSAGAISAYQAALDADPTNEAVLMKLGEIFAAADSTAIKAVPMEALTPISNDPGGFEAAPASPSAPVVQLDPGYLGLRGLVMLGELDKAYGLAEERDDLLGACIMAKVYALRGEAKKARRVLQESMDEVDEDASGYSEGLWGLALIAAMLGKARTAARLLGELERLVPGHRSQDIEALRAGLKR